MRPPLSEKKVRDFSKKWRPFPSCDLWKACAIDVSRLGKEPYTTSIPQRHGKRFIHPRESDDLIQTSAVGAE